VTAAFPDSPVASPGHLTGNERKDDLAGALAELDVLACGLPITLQGERARLASLNADVGSFVIPA